VVWSEAQRQALAADPLFKEGFYDPERPPVQGLAAARCIAMISYRSPESLERRFGRATGGEIYGRKARDATDLAVKGWLQHHGAALVERFDANSYRVLLDAMDTHDLARGRGVYEQVLKSIRQPVLIGSVTTDALYVPAEQRLLALLLPNGQYFEIDSLHGHDGFLIDADRYESVLRCFVAAHASRATDAPEDHDCVVTSAEAYRYAW